MNKMKKTIKNNPNTGKLKFIGASLAGLAASAYFFLGPDGKKNQKQAKAWAIKMKGDVVEKLEMVRELSEPAYHKIIDSIAIKHKKELKAGHEEIMELAQDLKKHWKIISNLTKTAKSDVTEDSQKIVKDSIKVVKKIKNNQKKLNAPKNKIIKKITNKKVIKK